MKKNYIKLDPIGQFVLLYGFEKLNEKAYIYYSAVSSDMVVFTNTPQYNDCCYALYTKRVNVDYALVKDDKLYTTILDMDMEYMEYFWIESTDSYLPIPD